MYGLSEVILTQQRCSVVSESFESVDEDVCVVLKLLVKTYLLS